jgi:ATP-dependent DNA helicase RecG
MPHQYRLTDRASHIKIPRVGPKIIESLEKAQLYSFFDLLCEIPLRFKNKLSCVPFASIVDQQEAYIEGLIIQAQYHGPKIYKALIQDSAKNYCELVFFRVSEWTIRKLKVGLQIRAYGKAQVSTFGLQMVHPDIDSVSFDEKHHTPVFEPIYPSHQGVSQNIYRHIINYLFEHQQMFQAHYQPILHLFEQLHAWNLPYESLKNYNTIRDNALKELAFFEGLSFFQKWHLKKEYQEKLAAPLLIKKQLADEIHHNLSYRLTDGQQRIWKAIQEDLAKVTPMQRLVQGDVGSGKTILGFLALAQAASNGYQSVMMAPTELLALQHFKALQKIYPQPDKVRRLTGSLSSKERRYNLAAIAEGHVDIVLGTQALFQDQVEFKNLGLVVIDEQQRFGVAQRTKLIQKGLSAIHYLTLTATPIPRSLAMALYGQTAISLLTEKPAGRQKIQTYTLSRYKRSLALGSVRNCVQKGHQCYWICPFIEESQVIEGQAAKEAFDSLSKELPELRIGLLHGRIEQTERDALLTEFNNGLIDVLVATLVVEVGIDNPNASLIVIESPERLGLAQLHQLRGRVGRGSQKSYCLLLYGEQITEQAIQRLQSLCEYDDGFKLAEIDLELRGAGQLLGIKQSGFSQFRFFDLKTHEPLISRILHHIPTMSDSQKNLLDEIFGEADPLVWEL